MSRSIYVPDALWDYGRCYDTIENTGPVAVTVEVRYYGNLGSDSSTVVWATSSGDVTVGIDDEWFATDDIDGSSDPLPRPPHVG